MEVKNKDMFVLHMNKYVKMSGLQQDKVQLAYKKVSDPYEEAKFLGVEVPKTLLAVCKQVNGGISPVPGTVVDKDIHA